MKKFSWRHYLMIVILALAAYAPTLRMGFLWDDHVMIESNPYLRGWTFQNLKHDFTSDVFNGQGDNYYRPVQTLTNRLDYTLWGLRPFGFHLTNFAIHSANSLLLSQVALALGFTPLVSLLVGCLLAVHPIGVEQLMIIAGRAELLGFCFSLISILLLLKKDSGSLALASLTHLLSLFSKESAVITPVLAAVAFYLKREPWERYKRILPLVLITLPYLWLRAHAVPPSFPHPDLWLATRFFIQAFPKVLARYALLILIPWNLHSHRLMLHLSHLWPLNIAFLVAFGTWLIKKNYRAGFFCLAWFILSLLPKTPVMIFGNFMLDHWAYPAALGVLFPLSIFFASQWDSQKHRLKSITGLALFPLLIAWALLVHLNVALRGTDEKMYRWALHFTTSNPIKYNLGVLLLQTGRAPEAIEYLEEVRQAYPEDVKNANALALAYWWYGQKGRAIRLLEQTAKEHPNDPVTRRHLEAMINRSRSMATLKNSSPSQGRGYR